MPRRWAVVPAICVLSSVFVTRAGIADDLVAWPALDLWSLEWDAVVVCDDEVTCSTA